MRPVALAAISALALVGCTTMTRVQDLQAVFGPPGIAFEECTLMSDLNGDGNAERLLFFVDKRRGLDLPQSVSDIEVVDGFAVFDGIRPNVLVFYVYSEYDGYQIRLDDIDGQRCLVSDGGRDHVQHFWGWWRYPDPWPPAGWEARERLWDRREERYAAWKRADRIGVVVGK